MNFDKYLEQRLGIGKYQYQTFLVLSLIDFIDGSESAFLGILLSILSHEWSLTQTQLIVLGSMYSFGMFIGALSCAIQVDHYGRRNTLIVLSFFQVVAMILTSLCQNYNQMVLLRFVYGYLFGVTMPISAIMLSETITKQYRGRFLTAICFVYQLGKMMLVLLCMIFLEDFSKGNWRGLILLNASIAFLCFLFAVFILKESPRFVLSKGRYDEAFQEIDEIGRQNKGQEYEPLTDDEKDQIIQAEIKKYESRDVKLIVIFQNKNLLITLTLWMLFGLTYTMNTGMYLLLPFILQDHAHGFSSLLITYIGELFAIALAFFLIDEARTGGRKGILISSSVLLILLNFGLYQSKETHIVFLATFIKMQYRLIQPTLSSLAGESYLTLHRSLGVASANFFGRLCQTFSPWMFFALFAINTYLPFLITAILGVILLMIAIIYPVDKTQADLEHHSEIIKGE